MRVPQPPGRKGSLKWIQRLINEHPQVINDPITAWLKQTGSIEWRSPLECDDFAEYRDGSFLDRVGHGELTEKLSFFWPSLGPQWDALGITESRKILLVEAKAHIGEICSLGTGATGSSLLKIEKALAATASHVRARKPKVLWTEGFYQLANRLAHLHFLQQNEVDARLILINFVGDLEMNGPMSRAEWQSAYKVVTYVMGLPTPNPLSKYILHLYPSVSLLEEGRTSR